VRSQVHDFGRVPSRRSPRRLSSRDSYQLPHGVSRCPSQIEFGSTYLKPSSLHNQFSSSILQSSILNIPPAQQHDQEIKMSVQTERLFCWTVCAYRKPGMSEEDYHKYMSEVHAPLVKDLMVEYGIVSWEMVFHTLQRPLPLTQVTECADTQHNRDSPLDGSNRGPSIQWHCRLRLHRSSHIPRCQGLRPHEV